MLSHSHYLWKQHYVASEREEPEGLSVAKTQGEHGRWRNRLPQVAWHEAQAMTSNWHWSKPFQTFLLRHLAKRHTCVAHGVKDTVTEARTSNGTTATANTAENIRIYGKECYLNWKLETRMEYAWTSLNIVVILGCFRHICIASAGRCRPSFAQLDCCCQFQSDTMDRKQQKPPSTCRKGKSGKPKEMKHGKMMERKIRLKKHCLWTFAFGHLWN